MSEIESKVKAIIVEKLGVDEAEVKPEASFTNDLGADSLDTVELIMEFEKEFGISIPDDKAEKIKASIPLLGFFLLYFFILYFTHGIKKSSCNRSWCCYSIG